MTSSANDDTSAERANELYWASERSVNQIAQDLKLSKGALYDLVQPLPSGLPCPRCSVETEYANRTARDNGVLTCPSCDVEEDEERVRAAWRDAARDTETGTVVVSPRSGPPARAPALEEEDRDRARVVIAGALLGAAAGLALVLWARRK